eukprot:6035-Rhodomonas_salina.1
MAPPHSKRHLCGHHDGSMVWLRPERCSHRAAASTHQLQPAQTSSDQQRAPARCLSVSVSASASAGESVREV